ncbi:glycosyltransferase [Geminicoccaceae bacterium 1502E]|nr:glycosyltransferase [Geminicoccaceae bacterium 1502E]
MILVLYVLVLAALVVHAPLELFTPEARAFLVIAGVIGAWRYGWQLLHLVRSLVYRRLAFPRLRRRAEACAAAAPTPELFIVVTSYRIPAETTASVFRAAIAEAAGLGRPVTLVAAVGEAADQRFVKAVFQTAAAPPEVRLALVRLPPRGKRPALAAALRAVARLRPHPEAAVMVMDGDAVLPEGSLLRCLPLLQATPRTGAITTDQDAVVAGGRLQTAWHRLRFAQRHVVMSSLSLSRRLLVITGRMAVYRAAIATDPRFIARIENDALDHWRLGRVPFLTGEDKSSWSWLLEQGHDMIYVPDVRVTTIEHPPAPGFAASSTRLMLRWFGNMLRAGGRAIALGPARVGLFPWLCLVDQRVSMWTTLVGPVAAVLIALVFSPVFLYAYLVWVMATRLVQTLALLTARPRISGLWPILLYYTQIWGALVKTWVLFRPDHQRWTRQDITLAGRGGGRAAALGSAVLHGLALTGLATAVALAVGALAWPAGLAPTRLF